MTSLAIPPTPPPAGNGTSVEANAATETGTRFDDALRQTQPRQQPRDGARHDAPAPPGNDARAAGKEADATAAQDGDRDTPDTTGTPGTAPAIAALIPASMRQPLAATGNPAPAAAVPATAVTGTPTQLAPTALTEAAQAAPYVSGSPSAAMPTAAQALAPGIDLPRESVVDSRETPAQSPHDLADFAAHLAHAPGTQPGPATTQAPPPAQLSMQATPGQPQFTQEAAQHVSWLVGQDIKQARIQLNPRDLGPIHVEINTRHDRVDVSFAAQHPQTVHALQQTLPQLHDMLAQQGLNLGHASVGQQAPDQQQAGQQSGGGGLHRPHTDDVDIVSSMHPSPRMIAPGRVDDFA